MWPWVDTLESSESIGTLTRVVAVNSPPLTLTALGPSLDIRGISDVHAWVEA